jgi:hypothetical protein
MPWTRPLRATWCNRPRSSPCCTLSIVGARRDRSRVSTPPHLDTTHRCDGARVTRRPVVGACLVSAAARRRALPRHSQSHLRCTLSRRGDRASSLDAHCRRSCLAAIEWERAGSRPRPSQRAVGAGGERGRQIGRARRT